MSEQQAFFLDEEELLGHSKKRRHTRKTSAFTQYTCETCGLFRDCKNPKMRRYGGGRKDILVVGLAPGREEDKQGIQFVGESGQLVDRTFEALDIDFEKDCTRTNLVACRPTRGRDNRDPTSLELQCCFSRLEKDIYETHPKLIICLGKEAINSVLRPRFLDTFETGKVHGLVFPSQEYDCWIGCSYHPASKPAGIRGGTRGELLFGYDIINILKYLDKSLPRPLTTKGNILVDDSQDAIDLFEVFSHSKDPIAFDYEATCISPYDEKAELLSIQLSDNVEEGYFIPLYNFPWMKRWNEIEMTFVYKALEKFLISKCPKIIQGYNMEVLWSRKHVGVSPVNIIHDTMVSHHVVHCRKGTTGLDFQVYWMTGYEYKYMVDHDNLKNEKKETLVNYGCFDPRYTRMAYSVQMEKLEGAKTKEFNQFLTSCLPVLANMTDRGIKVDEKKLNSFEKETETEMLALEKEVRSLDLVKKFEVEYGKRFNINAPRQHADLLYKICGEKIVKRTPTKEGSADEAALKQVLEDTKNNDTKMILEKILKHKKRETFLKKIVEYKGLLDPKGYLHPSYWLNRAESYRSASSNPNFQNVFMHDIFLVQIRKCMIPRYDLYLEGDYSGVELAKLAMVSGDKNLCNQLITGVDSHRRWAARIYEKDEKDITVDERFNTKSSFVFLSIYGGTAEASARYLGLPVRHVEKVQKAFWKEYAGVRLWQKKTLKFYLDNGYVRGVTGFIRPGPLSDEQLYNTPIQGPAFHLVLSSLQEIDDEMIKRKMTSILINQAHDSALFDVKEEEAEEVLKLSNDIMCSERVDRCGIPMKVKWTMSRKNWLEMEDI